MRRGSQRFRGWSFFQFDGTEKASVATFSLQEDNITVGVNVFSDAESQSLDFHVGQSLNWKPAGGRLKFGPAIRLANTMEVDFTADIGARIIYDQYRKTDNRAFFWLADLSTIDESVFLLAQFGFLSRESNIEISYGRTIDYSDISVAFSQRIGETDLSARVGYRIIAEDYFIGISYSTL